jgi:hypothetical protein
MIWNYDHLQNKMQKLSVESYICKKMYLFKND